MWAVLAYAATVLTMPSAGAEALLVVEADTGKVLYAHNAGYPWYPASVTKLMTTYVTLTAVKEGRVTLDTPLTVSPNAVAQSPVKMGFPTGTIVTVDNALKMLMVKSANDMAVVLAEGVSGSIESFAQEMNGTAQRLGMIQSNFVNPNGLPADEQMTSARDLAILARALIHDFPEYDYYWHLPGIRMGKMVQRNYNTLIGRYPGADGMKTGFICASGFNLVASATRNGKRLIAVVLGAPSAAGRALKAAQLLERGFASQNPLNWLTPSLGTVDSLQPVAVDPPNLRDQMCGGHRKRPASEDEDDLVTDNPNPDSPYATFLASLQPGKAKAGLLQQDVPMGEPVLVYTGTKAPAPGTFQAGWKTSKPKAKKTAAKSNDADKGKGGAATEAEPAKPSTPKKTNAKPTAAAGSSDSQPAKPKPKKPAPKNAPTALTPTTDQATQAR
jgi:D-alanyl-D-alanine carboxypeptidase